MIPNLIPLCIVLLGGGGVEGRGNIGGSLEDEMIDPKSVNSARQYKEQIGNYGKNQRFGRSEVHHGLRQVGDLGALPPFLMSQYFG